MNLVMTGSLGHVGRPLVAQLVHKKHNVTVVTSKPERKAEIEAMGAKASVGSVEDRAFLSTAFQGADAVFLLIAPGGAFVDHELDIGAKFRLITENFSAAIEAAGIRSVVYLSSIGAHLGSDNGLLKFHHAAEGILDKLAKVSLVVLRPAGFYTNLFGYLPTIKSQGMIFSGYGDKKGPWVSPLDIAEAAAEELEALGAGPVQAGSRKVRYVASEELSGQEVARILGQAIGKPELKWAIVPDQQLKQGMVGAGMPAFIAEAMVEMQASQRSGKLYEDYHRSRPVLGRVKLAEFAKEFAAVYSKS